MRAPAAARQRKRERYQIWRKFKIKCREQRYELFIITPEVYGGAAGCFWAVCEKRASTWGKIYFM